MINPSLNLIILELVYMADPGIGTFVRNWLHYSNMTSSFYKQFNSVRKIRDDFEKQVIDILQQKGMEKAVIQINNGRINVMDKKEPNPLSLTRIEELLHQYFSQRGGQDETSQIIQYIKGNRGYNVTKSLKQSGMPQQKPALPLL